MGRCTSANKHRQLARSPFENGAPLSERVDLRVAEGLLLPSICPEAPVSCHCNTEKVAMIM